jgi:hypothetical protein
MHKNDKHTKNKEIMHQSQEEQWPLEAHPEFVYMLGLSYQLKWTIIKMKNNFVQRINEEMKILAETYKWAI